MMRHNVGDEVYVVLFTVESKNQDSQRGPRTSMEATFFLPWEDLVTCTKLQKLVVTEHHKVPGYYGESIKDLVTKPEFDGYVLRGEDGSAWYNQYPRASYGQVSDAADRIYRRLADKLVPATKMYTGFIPYMENVLRGIHLFENGDTKNEERARLLKKHYDDLRFMFERTSEKTLSSRPHQYEDSTGPAVLDGWFDVLIVEVGAQNVKTE